MLIFFRSSNWQIVIKDGFDCRFNLLCNEARKVNVYLKPAPYCIFQGSFHLLIFSSLVDIWLLIVAQKSFIVTRIKASDMSMSWQLFCPLKCDDDSVDDLLCAIF